ncbi:MAG: hypothetical protein MZV65_35430 [Chromatiales bacterium]|nr:hypothetical protein [Chromatiales bacterium]
MPYRINWEKQGIYNKLWDSVDIGQIRRMMDVIGADERFDGIHYVLNDYLDVTQLSLTPTHIDEIVAIDIAQSYSNPRYYSISVAKDKNILKLLEYWASIHITPGRVALFTSLEQARAWISTRPPLVTPRWMPISGASEWR